MSALKWLAPFVPGYVGSRSLSELGVDPQTITDPASIDKEFLVLDNIFAPFTRPACLDVKITLPSREKQLDRIGVGNLLGCYIHGVESDKVSFRNRFNEYTGRNKPIDHFYWTFRKFFTRLQAPEHQRRELLAKMRKLATVLSNLSTLGFHFVSSSILFVYEQKVTEDAVSPNLYLVDFERTLYKGVPLAKYISAPETFENPVATFASAEEFAAKPPRYANDNLSRVSRIITHAARQYLFPDEFAVTVYLVRHGERHDYTDFSWAPNSPYPHDAHLSEAGERQSEDFVDRLRHLKVQRLASAPMQRAVLGAEPIARATRSMICIEPGFTEFLCSKTRTRVPNFFSHEVSISPWVDDAYKPYWPTITLETWPDVFRRSAVAVEGLLGDCRKGKGDLVIISHRSTLQTVFKALLPDFEDDTMLEYGGMSMISETEPGSGKFEMITFNELNHLRDKIKSPSSNPFRHIEGYYEDLSWSTYKSTAEMWENSDGKKEEGKGEGEKATVG